MTYDKIIEILDKETPLTQEEERVIFEYYGKHPSLDLKNRIAMKNIGLINQVILRYSKLGVEYDDLWQTGFFGLYRAIDKFDYKRGFKFSTYAFDHIRSFAQRYLQNNIHKVRIPNYAHDHLYRISNFISKYEKEHGEEPSHTEIAKELELDEDFVTFLTTTNENNKGLSLDYVSPNEDYDCLLSYFLKDEKAEDEFENVLWKVDSEKFLKVIKDTLNKSEYDVIMKRFGFYNGVSMTFGMIAAERNCTSQRIQQIEAKAMKKLKHPHCRKKLASFLKA